jgi:DNA polymerase III subunit delta'
LKPARGGRKVAILDDADDLNEEAANAFLKTLEEPPPGSVLVLIGGVSPDGQLQTILSRCQTIPFQPIKADVLRQVLIDRGVSDPERLDRLGRVAGGSVGQALALDDEELWNFRKTLLAALIAEKVDAFALALAWNQFVEEAGKDAGVKRRRASLVIRLLIGMLQDALRLSQGLSALVADPSETSNLKSLAERLGPEKLIQWADRAMEADIQIDRKVQLELIVEAFADFMGR